MSCASDDDHGAPYELVLAKRSFDTDQVGVDWHDYLIKKRVPGKLYQIGDVFRPLRAQATGLQYRCTSGGVASGAPFQDLRWPRSPAATITDGQVTWIAEAISSATLISTISSAVWVAPTGVTLGAETIDDLRYMVLVAGGTSSEQYELKHQITLASGQRKEAVVVLPVLD